MTYKYNVKGVGLDQIFEPYVSGTKAAITNYTVSGVDLKDIFAPLYLGSAAAVTNYKVKGVDLNAIFAAKGTVIYALPINGNNYTAGASRTTARLMFTITDTGTYTITRKIGVTAAVTLDSGTWLPAGDVVSNWQYQFTQTGFTNGPDPGGGTDTFGGNTGSAAAISGSPQFYAQSASALNTTGSNVGSVTLILTKTGGGTITTTVNFDCESTG